MNFFERKFPPEEFYKQLKTKHLC